MEKKTFTITEARLTVTGRINTHSWFIEPWEIRDMYDRLGIPCPEIGLFPDTVKIEIIDNQGEKIVGYHNFMTTDENGKEYLLNIPCQDVHPGLFSGKMRGDTVCLSFTGTMLDPYIHNEKCEECIVNITCTLENTLEEVS